ncbi:hypothetical protein SEA_BOILGATE_80 [Mycobacterium phage Boilgate]|nr:hypothetical protein SEA_BOILGATE_80 [Mycobacterium phage Boilgate]
MTMNSQHIILNALTAAVEEAVNEGRLPAEVFDDAPQSHVFMREPGEYWDEDDVEAIRLATENDVAEKIRYYAQVIDSMA